MGGGDDNIQYDVHHATLSSPSYHHAIIMQSLTYAFHHTLTEIRREGTGGGWVGGGDNNMYIRMWQWRHWHSSQHASLLTLTSKALSKKRNE